MNRGTATARPAHDPGDTSSAPEWFAIRDARAVESIRVIGEEAPITNSTEPALYKSFKRRSRYTASKAWHENKTRPEYCGQFSMLDVALFLENVYHLCDGDEHGAVDAVYNFMDDCLLDGDFTACDAALLSADPKNMLHSVILSLLIVTQRAKDKLKGSRPIFYDKAVAAVSATHGPGYTEELLGNNQ